MATVRKFLGIVQVPVANLQFQEDLGEPLFDNKHAAFLKNLFEQTHINLEDCKNWVHGYVDNSEAQSVMNQLGLSPRDLQEMNRNRAYPRIDNQLVLYTQGRHRIEAAKSIDPLLQWSVELFSTDLRNIWANKTIKQENEQFIRVQLM